MLEDALQLVADEIRTDIYSGIHTWGVPSSRVQRALKIRVTLEGINIKFVSKRGKTKNMRHLQTVFTRIIEENMDKYIKILETAMVNEIEAVVE